MISVYASQSSPRAGLRARRTRFSEAGAALWEGSLGLTLFFFLLIVGFDVIRMTYVSLGGQFAVDRTVRWASLGEKLVRDAGSGPVELDRIASIKQKLIESAAPFGLSPNADDIRICPVSDLSCSSDDLGASRALFRIEWRYSARLVCWPRTYDFKFHAYGQNEV
jgi:hypothetical protein